MELERFRYINMHNHMIQVLDKCPEFMPEAWCRVKSWTNGMIELDNDMSDPQTTLCGLLIEPILTEHTSRFVSIGCIFVNNEYYYFAYPDCHSVHDIHAEDCVGNNIRIDGESIRNPEVLNALKSALINNIINRDNCTASLSMPLDTWHPPEITVIIPYISGSGHYICPVGQS